MTDQSESAGPGEIVATVAGADVAAEQSADAITPPLERPVFVKVPARHNQTLARLMEAVNADRGLHALWRCANVNAVDRLGMSDHGPVHVQIVANIGLRLLRLLVASGSTPTTPR